MLLSTSELTEKIIKKYSIPKEEVENIHAAYSSDTMYAHAIRFLAYTIYIRNTLALPIYGKDLIEYCLDPAVFKTHYTNFINTLEGN